MIEARVLMGQQDVTATLPASAFHWRRITADTMADIIWADNHQGQKTILVTRADVANSATFECNITA